ncbi:MAG: NAD(P)H-binding protein, partial [Pseudomonadota bacterium]
MALKQKVVVAGASGTIGRAVVRECVARGYAVTAWLRSEEASGLSELRGADVRLVDVSQQMDVSLAMAETSPDSVISCLASRSGSPKDAKAVDYDANMHLLIASESQAVQRFVLLSAICVQKPRLAFQKEKLGFEQALQDQASFHYTIVRPTAYFKSLSGQVKRVVAGKPFLIFGDGALTRCKPISDADLARFIVDAMTDPEAINRVLPTGGPGPAITLKQQGELLFEVAGKEPKFTSVPVWMFDAAALVNLGSLPATSNSNS